jgi:anti-anti-sigma factor
MRLEVLSDDGEVLRLRALGPHLRVDPALEQDPLGDLLDDRGYARLVLLSLADAKYIDSSGLAVLLGWHRRFSEGGGKLVVHSIPTQVMDILRILRVEIVLHLAKDESEALVLARGESQ